MPIHSGDVPRRSEAGLAMTCPIWGYPPILDSSDPTARESGRARGVGDGGVVCAQSARGILTSG